MKVQNIVYVAISFVAMCVQPVNAADKADNIDLVRAVALGKNATTERLQELETIITQAKEKMHEARKQLFVEDATQEDVRDNVKVIIEQNAITGTTKHELSIARQNIKDKNAESGYVARFAAAVQNVGSGIVEKIKSVYDYSADEKKIARKIIKGLEKQERAITKERAIIIRGLARDKRLALNKRFKTIIAMLDIEIAKQQLITGDVMSTQKKLLVGAAVAAGAAAGLALADKYLEMAPEEVAVQSQPQESMSQQQESVTAPILTEEQISFISDSGVSTPLLSTPQAVAPVMETLQEEIIPVEVTEDTSESSSESLTPQEAIVVETPQEETLVIAPTVVVPELEPVVDALSDEDVKNIVEKEFDTAHAMYMADETSSDEIYSRYKKIEAIRNALPEGNVSLEDREYLKQVELLAIAQAKYDSLESSLFDKFFGPENEARAEAGNELKAAKVARDTLLYPARENKQQESMEEKATTDQDKTVNGEKKYKNDRATQRKRSKSKKR